MPNVELHLPGRAYVSDDRSTVLEQLAGMVHAAAAAAYRERGVFHLALSGGSTPEPLYAEWVIDQMYRMFPWQATHVWLVDERCVPLDDEKSNFRMIRETLIEHVPIPRSHVHPVPTHVADAADAYEAELLEVFGDNDGGGDDVSEEGWGVGALAQPRVEPDTTPRLDFVVLGMGDDCHTASLFPGSPAINEKERLVVRNEGPNVTPPPRVTMTYRLLNRARQLAVLVLGKGKAEALRTVAEACRQGEADAHQLPIVGIRPGHGELTWHLDREAAPE